MRYIKNVQVRFENESPALPFANMANAVSKDKEGSYTSVAHFLVGENPWGFQNDMYFTVPVSRARLGIRLIEAGEKALKEKAEYVELEDELYTALAFTLTQPQRFQQELAMPPALVRAIVPIYDAIEKASAEKGGDPVVERPAAAPRAAARSPKGRRR